MGGRSANSKLGIESWPPYGQHSPATRCFGRFDHGYSGYHRSHLQFFARSCGASVSVLREVQEEMLCLPGAGCSILELSHRDKAFLDILHGAEQSLRDLLGISDEYAVLFLQGGSRLQFSMVAANLLKGTGKTAQYLLTGSWSKYAIQEAVKEGNAKAIYDSKATNYNCLPKSVTIKQQAMRLTCTTAVTKRSKACSLPQSQSALQAYRWSAMRRAISCAVRSKWTVTASCTHVLRKTLVLLALPSWSSARICWIAPLRTYQATCCTRIMLKTIPNGTRHQRSPFMSR